MIALPAGSAPEERYFVNLPDKESHLPQTAPAHALDILAFVEAHEIPPDYFETPYYLEPVPGGENVYATLREALRRTGKIGIACVVIRSRQRLAALVPQGQSLVLNTLRWTANVLPGDSRPAAAGRHHDFSQRPAAALAEEKMKAKKGSEHIIVEELEQLLEDEESYDEDYLAMMLGRRMHPPDGSALRRSHPVHWQGLARSRRRLPG
ncbi:hypothetical protein EGT07_24570 [Herbaspirillum sp. HC18]|nr:hypothetical protein EGT07_24570 [Herbaspirillum sp. HC18]